MLLESEVKKYDLNYGQLCDETECEFSSSNSSQLKIKSNSQKLKTIFRPDFKFEDLGVGGLDAEISDIFRFVFTKLRMRIISKQPREIRHFIDMLFSITAEYFW